ncbi:PIN domain-containing protein [Candidatus Bipolaricaulota bacterium]|nr:PIN domain-containing protein [Candidatus Bipolaricaulota bacterium]
MPARYVVDTHALVWYLTKDRRLSPQARQVLRSAQSGEAIVLVSTIVLAEVLYIAENKRVPVEFPELLGRIRAGRGYQIVDFDLAVLQEMQKLSQDLELHDRALAATALVYDAALITKDRELQKLDRPKVVW